MTHRHPFVRAVHGGDIIHTLEKDGQLRFAVQVGYYSSCVRLVSNAQFSEGHLRGTVSNIGRYRCHWRIEGEVTGPGQRLAAHIIED